MTLWQTSLTYQIWVWLCDVYEDSTLHRFLAAAGRWCSGQIEESRILRPLCREGIVARSWRDSFLCRVLSALVNLPGTLLHAWYKAWNLTFEDSFFARLAFDMGDSASIAQFWCIAALWCIPYERWNNAYSFMTGVLLLLLFYAGAMRTGRRLDVARIGFYPALMLAAVTLAVTFSYAPGLSARFLIYHVSAALLVVITVSAVRNGEDLKRLCAGAAVCVGATGAYGIVQRIQGVKVNPSYVDLKVNAGMPGRVYSIFDNPNTFAQVLLLLLPLIAIPVALGKRIYEASVDRNSPQAKAKKAAQAARARLSRAKKALDRGDYPAFYYEMEKSLYSFIASKLKLARKDASIDRIRQEVLARGADPATADELIGALEACNQARYAGFNPAQSETDYQNATRAIVNINKCIKG